MKTTSRLVPIMGLLIACSDLGTEPDTLVLFDTVHHEKDSGIRAARTELITSDARWQQTWAEIVSRQSPQPPLPAVDFSSSVLILVARGETNNACRHIEIDRMALRGDRFDVAVKDSRSPPSCPCLAVVIHPVHVVAVPRSATTAAFRFRAVTEGPECR